MYGYNYDELYEWAEKLKAVRATKRIKEVIINSYFSCGKDDYQGLLLTSTGNVWLGEHQCQYSVLYDRPIYGKNMEIGSVVADNGSGKRATFLKQSQIVTFWAMQYFPYGTDDKTV